MCFFLGQFGLDVTYICFAFLLYMIIVRRVSSYFYHEFSSFFYIMMIMQCSVTILSHQDNSQNEGAQQASSAFCWSVSPLFYLIFLLSLFIFDTFCLAPPYLIFVTGTPGGAGVKKIARCKFVQIRRKKLAIYCVKWQFTV